MYNTLLKCTGGSRLSIAGPSRVTSKGAGLEQESGIFPRHRSSVRSQPTENVDNLAVGELFIWLYFAVPFNNMQTPCVKGQLLRPALAAHTRELAPETRSRHTLPGKYPNQYTRRTRRGSWMMKQPDWGMGTVVEEKISQFDRPTGDTSCHGKQISVHTRELAPDTDGSVQQICPWSLLPHIKPVWYEGAKLGSKRFAAQHIFSLEIVGADEGALLRERVAGACCGSKLPRVYRPLVTV